MSIEHEELADIFRTVARTLADRPWDTDIDDALKEIADEIESRSTEND